LLCPKAIVVLGVVGYLGIPMAPLVLVDLSSIQQQSMGQILEDICKFTNQLLHLFLYCCFLSLNLTMQVHQGITLGDETWFMLNKLFGHFGC
jgi:hypothetical protein